MFPKHYNLQFISIYSLNSHYNPKPNKKISRKSNLIEYHKLIS